MTKNKNTQILTKKEAGALKNLLDKLKDDALSKECKRHTSSLVGCCDYILENIPNFSAEQFR